MNQMNKVMYDKFLGCLVGGAAGDALGYAVEFDLEKGIFSRYGMMGIQEYELHDGKAVFSDDTQMTLFTAAGLLLAKNPVEYSSFICEQYTALMEWYETQTNAGSGSKGFGRKKRKAAKTWLRDLPALNIHRAPGHTCLSALGSKEMGCVEEPINNSKGCGGVMRVAPIGLFYDTKNLTIEDIDKRGAESAAITHGHPLGYMSAAGLVHLVQRGVHCPEMTLLQAVEEMIKVVSTLYPDCAGANQAFEALMKKAVALAASDVSDLDAIHQLGEGWVGDEALAIAIYCALKHSDDFDAAICAAVNHNGDSDSTGAIAGNILGAFLGYDKIPEKFKTNLEQTDVLERMAKELLEKKLTLRLNRSII